MSEYKTGILGASSWLARELLEWMEKWRYPSVLQLYDHQEACGKVLHYQDHYLPIKGYDTSMDDCDILFDCRQDEDDEELKHLNPRSYIIHFQKQAEGMVTVPNVNISRLQASDHHIRIPCASFLLLSGIVSVMESHCHVEQAVITSLHSVAELGDEGCTDLMKQIRAYDQGKEIESKLFPLKNAYQHLPLLFQVLPQTSCLCAEGSTCEEEFLREHMKDCFDPAPMVSATCVRVAGLRGLSMSLTMNCEKQEELESLIDLYASDPNIICIDDISHNMYPICADVIHDYRIYIGRMRKTGKNSFSAWAVCDDLAIRCAAALKAGLYILHNFL